MSWVDEVNICNEFLDERDRQDAKWGEQNHPDGTGPDLWLYGLPVTGPAGNVRSINVEHWAKVRTDRNMRTSTCTFEMIATEEWAEVLASGTPREELVQLGAVIVAWIAAIDRRSSHE